MRAFKQGVGAELRELESFDGIRHRAIEFKENLRCHQGNLRCHQ